jgi:membrane-bound lytic murein transglycosylase B
VAPAAYIAVVVAAVLFLQQPPGGSAAQSSTPTQDVPIDTSQPFDTWLEGVVAEARQRGFSDRVIDETLAGLEPLPRVIQSDRNQAELNPGFARYLSSHVPSSVVQRGREMAQQHQALLRRIETTYGVPGRLLLAIWGMETRYGRVTGRTPVFQALATLAWEPRRAEFFRGELFQALMMVDRGYIDAGSMTGSWAGAMGQTQFMPSSYMQYAVDFDGDGHRDIWRSTPDALASIANYLKGYGWTPDRTWGREVRMSPEAQAYIADYVPRRTEGCYARRNMTERIPMSAWRDIGVTSVDGSRLPAADVIAGLVDVGERKFLVYPNYDAILGYNCAHYYALTVAILADQFPGGSGLGLAAASTSPRVTPRRSTAASKARSTPKKRTTKKSTRPAPRRPS